MAFILPLSSLCAYRRLAQLPADRLTIFMPVFVLSNLLINTFYSLPR
jgi:hypothetical protein